MRRFISILVLTGAVTAAFAFGAPSAGAATWDIAKLPGGGPVVGHVATAGTTAFNVTNASDALVGKVVKTGSGAWKVMRGGTRIAVVKANGTNAYPVNLYDLTGKRIGRAGPYGDTWRVEKLYRGIVNVNEIRAYVPKSCPGRAALGAVRLVFWK